MNELNIFDYDGMKIETIMHDNGKGKIVPYFHGSSVAIVLGYENQQQAVSYNCTKVIKLSRLDIAKIAPLQSRDITPYKALTDSGYSHGEIIAKQSWIPEPDVYRLVLRSRKDYAEKFQDWVVEEVLPALRKDGMYVVGEEKVESGDMSIEEMQLKVMQHLQMKVERLHQERLLAESKAKALEVENEEILDQFVAHKVTVPQFCKQLNGVNTSKVQGWLEETGKFYKDGKGNFRVYGTYRDDYFTESKGNTLKGEREVQYTSIYLTKRGAKWIYKKYRNNELPMKVNWDGKLTQEVFKEDFMLEMKIK
ncbi:anti-repressor Ant [Vibrio phage 11895-B1]|uniref:anti-repressor Ant n=1 Tax=Vibrio phage 11895-B1 TaxID=754075 RepID=UPI0002C0A95D|nr:anti-repressor Ant [Vibrio phage 11895-B1]AGH32181.1 BRO domain-containing protein [Vibrio phage 11895-B1]